jgi:hypothetical protein
VAPEPYRFSRKEKEMINSMTQKMVLITSPGAIVDNASLTTTAIDTAGWDVLDVFVIIGATDIAMAALKLQTSDDDGNADAYADLANANFATGTMPNGVAAVLPAASGATGDNTIHHINVVLNGKERYFDLVATGGDGSAGAYIMAFAILSRGKESPNTFAERGFAQELIA